MTSLVYTTLLDMLHDDGFSTATMTVWHRRQLCGYAEASKDGEKWWIIAPTQYQTVFELMLQPVLVILNAASISKCQTDVAMR